MEDLMKSRQTLLLLLILALTFIINLPFFKGSPSLTLLKSTTTSFQDNVRHTAQSLFTLQTDDFGQPISIGEAESNDTIPIFSNVTSQPLILEQQLELTKTKINETEQQLKLLYEQQQILSKESQSFEKLLSQTYLSPLNKIKRKLRNDPSQEAQALVYIINASLQLLLDFSTNPNDTYYDGQMKPLLTSLNQMGQSPVNPNFLHLIPYFLQHGPQQTKILINQIETQSILNDFKTLMQTTDSHDLNLFKQNKRQALATINAIELRSAELDQLLYELTSLLDELEQATQ